MNDVSSSVEEQAFEEDYDAMIVRKLREAEEQEAKTTIRYTSEEMRKMLKEMILSHSHCIASDETLLAMKEVEEMKKNPDQYKGYTDVDEMMNTLLK